MIKVVKDFDNLTVFMEDGLIPKTSNHAERYFSRTLSKQYKKKFGTVKGVLSYLHGRMVDTTEIYMKKFQHPFLTLSKIVIILKDIFGLYS